MGKWIIELRIDNKAAKEILSAWQYRVFTIKQKAFLKIMEVKFRAKCTEIIKVENKITFIDENDSKEYLENQKKMLEDFIYSDQKELTSGKKNQEFASLANDRIIQKINKSVHKLTAKAKDKAMKSFLSKMDILGFWARIGIFISWRIEYE